MKRDKKSRKWEEVRRKKTWEESTGIHAGEKEEEEERMKIYWDKKEGREEVREQMERERRRIRERCIKQR